MKNLMALTLLTSATLFAGTAFAANVDARLSTREAYVGMPITLQITVSDAADYKPPAIPQIDGCEVRSAGTPSQSSQITIINGRRSESRTVTMQYLITPRREGTFEIPSFTLEVDQKPVTIQSQRFVVTKSITGDLLFVEIEGGKDKVFVGQPLDLNLRIWLKPFRDMERNLTLSEGDMWKMISEQSSWGGFTARMKELADNDQRPRGQEVLRDEGKGNQRSYYLYEIAATVYPKRPGKIDADDVQIVVNYPTALGKSRSPFGSMFDDSLFGGRSPLSSMMHDDFFASSFGNRLTVSSTRPIVGEVSVDATEVMPVPVEGRPADYRGAVGRYRIVTHATPTTVNAGDPITLNIGIEGTGPMELVQAPPLSQQDSLTADFKVADESLAGFVQDDTKVFSTTIRPRREGKTEIPPIRFSFFDPETQSYETVMSEPIAITVNKAEMLALDAIVGQAKAQGGPGGTPATTANRLLPDFTNNNSTNVLISQSPRVSSQWWWVFVVAPPIVWFVALLLRHRKAIAGRLPSLRSASSRCLAAIERAEDGPSIAVAMTRYIAQRTAKECTTSSHAVGALRGSGMYDIANEVETFLQEIQRGPLTEAAGPLESSLPSSSRSMSWVSGKAMAIALTEKLDGAFAARNNTRVRSPKSRMPRTETSRFAQRSLGLMLAAVLVALSTGSAIAADSITLSSTQQQAILTEAGEAYTQASNVAKTDSATAKELFQVAANKYQLIVDSGVQNGGLYANLGNAYLQSGELGRAIASYELARRFEPHNRQLNANFEFANARVQGQAAASTHTATTSLQSLSAGLRWANSILVQFIGEPVTTLALILSSLVFWGLLVARTTGHRLPIRLGAAFSLSFAVLIASLTSTVLTKTEATSKLDAVIVANNVSLHAGDGEQFSQIASIDAAQGHRVEVLGRRGNWTQVRTADGQTGWMPAKDVQQFGV